MHFVIIDFIQVLWNVNKVILHIVLLQVVREVERTNHTHNHATLPNSVTVLLYPRAHYTIEVVHIVD
jgi:hypothetical protein